MNIRKGLLSALYLFIVTFSLYCLLQLYVLQTWNHSLHLKLMKVWSWIAHSIFQVILSALTSSSPHHPSSPLHPHASRFLYEVSKARSVLSWFWLKKKKKGTKINRNPGREYLLYGIIMSRKENDSFLFCPPSSIKMQICYLQQAESLSYCPLYFEDRRSDLENEGLDLWEIDYKASLHLLGTYSSFRADCPWSGWEMRCRKYKVKLNVCG